jgi:hypothetical protein
VGAAGAPAGADPAAARPARPDYIPEQFWDAEKGEAKAGDLSAWIKRVSELEAREAERAKGVPEKPEGYAPTLPETFKAPEGVEVRIDPNDPLFVEARQFAKEQGLTQAEFSKMLAIEAKRVANEATKLAEARKAQKEALGENGQARIDALDTKLKARLTHDEVGALWAGIATAAQVAAFEKLVGAATSDGVGGFQQGGSKAPAGQLSEEDYQKLSLEERINYTERRGRWAA